MRVGAVTMVHNEPVWARVWVEHYARQVGAENCLVLDHGSTDGSTSGLGVAVERVPRTMLDEDRRAGVVSDCVAQMLKRFDAVVHTDADELLVADPGGYPDLRAFAASVGGGAVTATGLDLQHLPGVEAAFDPAVRVGAQRRWVRFSGAMCKPCLVTEPVRWTPGFHGCDAARRRGAVYLVHLRFADLGLGLARLGRTRALAFRDEGTNLHQRVPDEAFEGMMRAVASLPHEAGALAELAEPWMRRMEEGWVLGDAQLGLAGTSLWALPEGIRGAL